MNLSCDFQHVFCLPSVCCVESTNEKLGQFTKGEMLHMAGVCKYWPSPLLE